MPLTTDPQIVSQSDELAAKYVDGDYLAHHPTWDAEHSQRKARELLSVMGDGRLEAIFSQPESYLVDVGCGAGGVLYHLWEALRGRGIQTIPVGCDISPAAIAMAREQFGHVATYTCAAEVSLDRKASLVLLVDVLEHLSDPGALLRSLGRQTSYLALRIPLDRSLWDLSTRRLPTLKRTWGHIHFYTYRQALALLARHGLRVLDYTFTENFRQHDTRRTFVSRIMYPFRRVTSALSPKLNSLLWGGNSLVVLAATEDRS